MGAKLLLSVVFILARHIKGSALSTLLQEAAYIMYYGVAKIIHRLIFCSGTEISFPLKFR